MNKERTLTILAISTLALTAVIAPAGAFSTPAEVEYAAHDTETEFSNAKLLQNMKVSGDTVTLGSGSTSHLKDFEGSNPTSDFTVYYDNPASFTTSSNAYNSNTALLWQAGSRDQDNLALYNDFGTDGKSGTMEMDGYIEVVDVDDGGNPLGSFRLVNSSTGAFYELRVIDGDGTGDFSYGWSEGGQGATVNNYDGGFGNYEEGGYIRMEIKYDYSSNKLTANVYLLGASSPKWSRSVTTDVVPNPDSFGLGHASCGSGCDWAYYDQLTMESGVPSSATYASQAYSIDAPTSADVSIPTLSGGEATLKVVDGNGNVLGSKTVSSAGDHTVSADPTKQVGSKAHVRVEVADTGSAGDLKFTMDRESIWFEDDPPDASVAGPSPGATVYTNTPELTVDVSDPTFSQTQDETVTAEWYLDGSKVAEQTLNSPGQVSYEPAALAEGDHNWYVRVVDKYGGEGETNTNDPDGDTFTVDHKPPDIDNSSASPSGGETTPYSSETLSIDVSDYDFAHDGDSLTVGWYVDGTLVHEDSGISSNGTVQYTTAELSEGTHNWYVKVGDSWGDTVQSDTFNYEISHVEPTISNPSIDGRTYYESNTLSVDVGDRDFAADGDTVTVGIYVDGAKEYETDITNNQTVSFDAGPYADGDYTWHVEAADTYGYNTVSPTWDLNITHDKTNVTEPSIDGVTHYENNTLAVNVTDADFPRDGDTVDVGFYIEGTLNKTATISSNQTVTHDVGPYADGNYTWHVEAVDDYGHKTVTNTWWLNVSHYRPQPDLNSLSPTGTIHYENANLTAAISDGDFPIDGDTVDIAWYVDGTLLKVDTITADGTYNFVTPDLADGDHKWRIELYDDYGYVTSTTNETITVKHYPPQLNNSTASPQGTIRDQTPTFSIDVSDRDFPIDGDGVDMGVYIKNNNTNGFELIGVDTLYQNRTAKVTPDEAISGDTEYYWKAVDTHGYTRYSANFTIDPPNSLFLHGAERPHPLINETASVAVITGSNETTDLDTYSDGSIEFGDLPAGEEYVFSVTANNYYQREVYIDDLYSRSVIFLIPASTRITANTIEIIDETANYQQNPIVSIETVINTSKVSNMPDTGPEWVTVGGGRFGATEKLDVVLRYGGRYRFTVRNQRGDSRTVGYYTAKENGTIKLQLGQIGYPAPGEDGYTWDAYTNDTDGPGGSVTFAYNDLSDYTENVSVTVKERSTGAVIGTDTFERGPYGETVATFPVDNETFHHKDLVVSWTAYRNGTQITGKRVVSGQDYSQNVPLGDKWLKIVYGVTVLLIAFVGAAYIGAPGMFVILGFGAGLAALTGIAPPALGGGVATLTVGLGATMQRWKNKNTQPQ